MTIKSKKDCFYKIKPCNQENQVKNVDLSKRIVQGIFNTLYYIDSDMDMLVSGVANKSFADRGVNSQAKAKIKHIADHKLDTDHVVGRLTELDQRKIDDGRTVIYFESEIPKSTKGDDHLINYQEGVYDNHSIGFIYRDIQFAKRVSENEKEVKLWEEYIPQAINPEVAEERGYFWVVKEIELYEGSVVMFGANQLTEVLGIKSQNKESILLDLNKRLDILYKQYKSGNQTDDTLRSFELQTKQIKQIILDISKEQNIEDKKSKIITPKNEDLFDIINKNF